MANSKTRKISIGKIIQDSEMSRFVHDHVETKKMFKHVIIKLPFLIKYVPKRYKTQQMCCEVILRNGGMLFNPHCYKGQDM